MKTIEDIRNPARQSGFDHVQKVGPPTRWRGNGGGRKTATGGSAWNGTRRPFTADGALQAAQDYCDYDNGIEIAEQVVEDSPPTVRKRLKVRAGAGVKNERWTGSQRRRIREANEDGSCEVDGFSAVKCSGFPADLLECHHIIRDIHGVPNGAELCPNHHKLADREQRDGGGPITEYLIVTHELGTAA